MLLQLRLCSIFAELLGEGPFVFGAVAFEKRGRDPWLENEPATCVDAPYFLAAVVK